MTRPIKSIMTLYSNKHLAHDNLLILTVVSLGSKNKKIQKFKHLENDWRNTATHYGIIKWILSIQNNITATR